MLDISTQNPQTLCEQGHRFEFVVKELGIKDVYFTVLGEHAKAVKDYGKKMFTEMQAKGIDSTQLDLDDIEERTIEAAAIRVISWENVTENGEPLECNPENKKRVIAMFGSLLKDKIIAESNNLGNFGKVSQKKR